MRYARILALIDAELECLKKVRQLIAPSVVSPGIARRKALPLRAPIPATAESAKIEVAKIIAKIEETAAPPQVLKLEAARPARSWRAVRRKTPPVRKPAIEPVATALGGVVPAAPVFVSAEQIRQTQAQKQQAETPDESAFNEKTADPLTAEMLMQKWLHGSAS